MILRLNDFNYELPESLVAQKPHIPRDSSRLMMLSDTKDTIQHKKFRDVADSLTKDDVIVLNNTKVLHAKIIGKKQSGAYAEVVLTKRLNNLNSEDWICHVKTKNPHIGTIILFKHGRGELIGQKSVDEFIIRLSGKLRKTLPKPPYIKHELNNKEYQTVYAKNSGSLAASTAGLHFTNRLLKKIAAKGIKIVYITLHVSYGTFKNIDDINNYEMDPEYYEITKKAAETINNRKGRLFVVGTTTIKTLETSSKNGKIIAGSGESRLFIKPPFKFNSGTDVLITNFHLPKSSLLLLTCAFGGTKRILDAYKIAVAEKYRFYSLGDAMIIYRKDHHK